MVTFQYSRIVRKGNIPQLLELIPAPFVYYHFKYFALYISVWLSLSIFVILVRILHCLFVTVSLFLVFLLILLSYWLFTLSRLHACCLSTSCLFAACLPVLFAVCLFLVCLATSVCLF